MIRLRRAATAALAAAFAVALIAQDANARAGGGFSGGSRGMRTWSAPAPTTTAPSSISPIQRSATQPAAPRPAATGGAFNRPGGLFGGGLLGGLAAGFIGAGLFGLLFGHGMFGGLGGLASVLGLLLQIGLVVIVARLAWAWWQRRNQPAFAGAPAYRDSRPSAGGFPGMGGGAASAAGPAGRSDDIGVTPADYDAFERLLNEIQAAYSNGDLATLHARATPEMVGYFEEDLARNASQGIVDRISDVRLLQGDLAEAWREGDAEYATVAMRYSLVDRMVDRDSGRVVQGNEQPQEVTEVWTFVRPRGGAWLLSAIQQV